MVALVILVYSHLLGDENFSNLIVTYYLHKSSFWSYLSYFNDLGFDLFHLRGPPPSDSSSSGFSTITLSSSLLF